MRSDSTARRKLRGSGGADDLEQARVVRTEGHGGLPGDEVHCAEAGLDLGDARRREAELAPRRSLGHDRRAAQRVLAADAR